MAIEIKIVMDPFAIGGRVPRERTNKEEVERTKRAIAVQRERDERYRRKLIEMGLIHPRNETGKD